MTYEEFRDYLISRYKIIYSDGEDRCTIGLIEYNIVINVYLQQKHIIVTLNDKDRIYYTYQGALRRIEKEISKD